MRNSALLSLALPLLALAAGGVHAGGPHRDNRHETMVHRQSVCITCHTQLPKAGEHAADYFLVDAPSESCLGCHGEYEHTGVAEHAGKDAAPLPGDENGKIACFTCHDPHPEGVLAGRRVYETDVDERTRNMTAVRELPVSAERRAPGPFGALLRFSTKQDEGCAICHASDKEAASKKRRESWRGFIHVLPRY
jgi:hypothetical protein